MKIYVAGPDVWRAIPGYEGLYEISGHGEVRSLDRYDSLGRLHRSQTIKSHVWGTHYRVVKLSNAGKKSPKDVHVLVLRAFKGEAPEGMQACHRNDVPTDNRILNLYWGTKSQNMKDAVRNGNSKRENNPSARKTHCPDGHPYDGVNSAGARTCSISLRRAQDKYQAKKKRDAQKRAQSED